LKGRRERRRRRRMRGLEGDWMREEGIGEERDASLGHPSSSHT
jgi:hypothetical protein